MDSSLYFIKDDVVYFYVGKPEDYYYDFGLIPLQKKACNDIMEKARFVYALWELFTTYRDEPHSLNLPSKLVVDISDFFRKYEDFELWYGNLLDHQTLTEIDFESTDFFIDKKTKQLVLNSAEIKLVVPVPYEDVIGYNSEGEPTEIDKKNLKEFETLYFSDDDDFPRLFMSDREKALNEELLNKLLNKVIAIFNKHSISIKSYEDLFNYYEKTYEKINK